MSFQLSGMSSFLQMIMNVPLIHTTAMLMQHAPTPLEVLHVAANQDTVEMEQSVQACNSLFNSKCVEGKRGGNHDLNIVSSLMYRHRIQKMLIILLGIFQNMNYFFFIDPLFLNLFLCKLFTKYVHPYHHTTAKLT